MIINIFGIIVSSHSLTCSITVVNELYEAQVHPRVLCEVYLPAGMYTVSDIPTDEFTVNVRYM